jgi:hypothetical protein
MSQTTNPALERNGTKAKSEKGALTRADVTPSPTGPSPGVTLQPFDRWTRASQVALIGLFIIAVLWCTYVASPVIVPVLLAWVIATIVLPIVTWLCAHKVPRVLAVIAVTVALIGGLPAHFAFDAGNVLAGTSNRTQCTHQAEIANHESAAGTAR